MGAVYLAHDPRLDRNVAVKVIPQELLTSDTEERFRREARLIAKLDHPGIVVAYDVGIDPGALFLVMPYVEGKHLREFVREGATFAEIVDIARQVAEALDYSHTRGIVHRDVKPENILVTREGDSLRVRLTDFGIALASFERRVTNPGSLVGTIAYLSPEQLRGGVVTTQSDVFAFGAVLYECIAGEPPFGSEMPVALYRISHERPDPLRLRSPHVDEALDSIVMRCLEKDPANRPRMMSEIASTLSTYAHTMREEGRGSAVVTVPRRGHSVRVTHAPLVGRAHEMAQLEAALGAALNGEAQFIAIAGEEGVGKSRLIQELEQRVHQRGIAIFHARMHGFDSAFPYQGFGNIIQEYLRSPSNTHSTGGSDFSDLAADLVDILPPLTELLEMRYPQIAQRRLERHRVDERTYIFEVLAKALIRIACGKPMVLMFDDLHSVDATIDALQYVIRRLDHTPTLFVAAYRTTAVDRGHPLNAMLGSFRTDPRFTTLHVAPLPATDHRALITQILGGQPIDERLADKLFQATEGNPHFAIELVRSLIDSDAIAPANTGGWRFTTDRGIAADILPATIKEAIEERIERLPENLRDFLLTASILGKTFDSRELELLVDDTNDFDNMLDRLTSLRMIDELPDSRGERFTFSSGLLCDVLYSRLSPRRRRILHRRFAERLEQQGAVRAEVVAKLLHHYYEADESERVVHYGLAMAKSALTAFSADDAVKATRMVLTALQDTGYTAETSTAEVHLLAAEAHRIAGNPTAALRSLDTAAEEFTTSRLNERLLVASVMAAQIAWESRHFDDARKWVHRGLMAAGPESVANETLDLLGIGATLANLRADYATAKDYLDRATRIRGQRMRPTAARTKGGTINVAMLPPVMPRHPIDLEIEEMSEIYTTVFEPLTTVDREGNVVPLACDRWDLLDDGRRFRFTLHPRLTKSDGTRVTAADIKRAFDFAILQSRGELPAALAKTRTIIAESEQVLLFELEEPCPILPVLLGTPRTAIAFPQDDGRLLGTGPFQILEIAPDYVLVERNPNYWRGAPALADRLRFFTGVSASDMAAGLRSGQFDIVRDLLPQDFDAILRDRRLNVSVAEMAKKNIYAIAFNINGPLANDLELRRMLAGAVNARDLVQRTIGRFAQPAEGIFPPGILGHDPGRRGVRTPRPHVAEGTPRVQITASVHPVVQDRYRAFLNRLLETWQSLGVEVRIGTATMSEFVESWRNNTPFDLIIGRWNADYDDPDTFASGLLHSRFGAWRNYSCNAELDLLIERAAAERSPAARSRAYDAFEQKLSSEALFVPLFHEIDYRVASSHIRDLQLRPARPYVNYSELSKDTIAAPGEGAVQSREGGTLLIPMTAELWSLDPSLVSTVTQLEVIPNIFETLTKHSEGAGITPWLAEEFHADDQGTRFYFRLRDNVRFHDGRKLTSRDVRFTFERLLRNQESESRWLLSPIRGANELIEGTARELSGFRIRSATEFYVELEQPLSFFPALVAYEAASIVPEGTEFHADPRMLSGTGPFRVAAFDPGKHVELEANRAYWIQGIPKTSGLTFLFGISPQQIAAGFRGGKYSLVWDLLPEDVESLRRDNRFAATYRQTPLLSTGLLLFNLHKPPFDDEALRRRLARSIDVDSLIPRHLGRLGVPAHGLIPPGLLGYESHVNEFVETTQVIDRAFHASVMLHTLYEGTYSGLAKDVLNTFAAMGLQVEVAAGRAEFLRANATESADMFFGRWVADYPDTDGFVYTLLHTHSQYGRISGTPEADALMERARIETDPRTRHNIYRELDAVIARHALVLPLFHEQAYRFAHPDLGGIEVHLSPPIVPYEKLFAR